jgi:thioredoxin reductase
VDRELGRAVSHARVIIVGCGFAGLFAADALRRAEVEVVVVTETTAPAIGAGGVARHPGGAPVVFTGATRDASARIWPCAM